jgi:hypothetical protein
MGAQRIFIDGNGLLYRASNAAAAPPAAGPRAYREILQQLIEGLYREHLTTMLSDELGTHSQTPILVSLTLAVCLSIEKPPI